LDQPFGADLFDIRVSFALEDRIRKIRRQIHVEDLGQHAELLFVGDRLETGDDGDVDVMLPTGFYEVIIFLVVEEHLCGDILRPGVDLGFEVHHIGLEIRRLEMFLGIAGYPDAKIGSAAVLDILFEIDALVEADYLFEQVEGIAMAVGFRLEGAFVLRGVAPQDEDIVDAEEMEVDEGVFRLPFGEAAADEVRDGVDLIMVHDCGADAYGAGTFADFDLFEGAIGLFLEHRFAAVIGDIDECRPELHERVEMFIYRVDGLAFKRR
jgi:hypothetical protein